MRTESSFLKVLTDKRFVFFVWFLMALITGVKHSTRGVFNDYIIFKTVFYHTLEQVNLYLEYPLIHPDTNHYGPIFSLVFAPFALLPDEIGTILWEISMAAVLFIAIYKLPIVWKAKVIIYYICLQGLYGSLVNSETNTLVVALIIGTFICIRSEKDFWAACCITLGVFIKLYGIVGLAFFLFSKHKIKFVAYLILWSAVFFVLPMLISSPQFIIQCYTDWYESLILKNNLNISSMNQDISVMGLVRRTTGFYNISNIIFLLFGIILFGIQYLKTNFYSDLRFQLSILASTLFTVVLFSTGSETCTYIIPATGVGIWFIMQNKPYKKHIIILLSSLLIITLMSSGIAPTFIRKEIIRAHSLLALPYFIVWLTLIWQTMKLKKNNPTTLSKEYLIEVKD